MQYISSNSTSNSTPVISYPWLVEANSWISNVTTAASHSQQHEDLPLATRFKSTVCVCDGRISIWSSSSRKRPTAAKKACSTLVESLALVSKYGMLLLAEHHAFASSEVTSRLSMSTLLPMMTKGKMTSSWMSA